ncbi:hypothetical protein QTG56_24035 (plasmid) [Rossellomorea sp. AcN35-11]|nr:hypothetical protein [Rossellomorea aquimaris]WJV31709.1 hypothetical protein QTG56_24035 [Rossellomorea sp. AcN35-11]
MTVLTPFTYTSQHDKDHSYVVYSVNCTTPETTSGYVQGYWKCTECGKGNQFRFYDDTHHPNYHAKCPDCQRNFIAVDDTDMNE